MTISAVHNHILFQFVDPVNTRGEFEESSTESGIFIKGTADKSAKNPRWATVISVGPDCEKVQSGDLVLLPSLRWTAGVQYDEGFIWKTDETQVVGYKRTDVFTPINLYVIFTQTTEVVSQHESGLLLISHQVTDTPHGIVSQLSEDPTELTVGDTIYYDGANFFNTFKLAGKELSFIAEADILLYTPGA